MAALVHCSLPLCMSCPNFNFDAVSMHMMLVGWAVALCEVFVRHCSHQRWSWIINQTKDEVWKCLFFCLFWTSQAAAGWSSSAQTGSEDGWKGFRPLQRLPRHSVHQTPGQTEGRVHEAGGGGSLLRQLWGSWAHVPRYGSQVPVISALLLLLPMTLKSIT